MGSERLTPAQRDCLRLVGMGYSSKEIAKTLKLSPRTVDTYLSHAMSELNVVSRREAARAFAAQQEVSQNLRSQSQEVDIATGGDEDTSPEAASNPLVPPLGGAQNRLDGRARIVATVRVSLLIALAVGLMITVYAFVDRLFQ